MCTEVLGLPKASDPYPGTLGATIDFSVTPTEPWQATEPTTDKLFSLDRWIRLFSQLFICVEFMVQPHA